MLALAYHVERQIEAGGIDDYSAAAAALGVTRARLSQIASLLLLAPEIQERILAGKLRVSERDLRCVAAEPDWSKQIGLGRRHSLHAVILCAEMEPHHLSKEDSAHCERDQSTGKIVQKRLVVPQPPDRGGEHG